MTRNHITVWILGLALVLGLGLSATAEDEPGPPSRETWISHSVRTLAVDDLRLIGSAQVALTHLGVDGIPAMLPHLVHLESDVSWRAFERVLWGMGWEPAIRQLKGLRAKWPKSSRSQLRRILEAGKSRKKAPPTEGPPRSPIATRLDGIFDPVIERESGHSRYRKPNPTVRALIAVGRDAIGPLLDVASGIGEAGHCYFCRHAAIDALAELASVEDLPRFRAYMRRGHLDVARGLSKLRGAQVRSLLLEIVDRGFLAGTSFSDSPVVAALESHATDPQVPETLGRWIGRFGFHKVDDFHAIEACELIAKSGHTAALPELNSARKRARGSQVLWRLDIAMLRLGDKPALERMTTHLQAGSGWTTRAMLEVLAEISGKDLSLIRRNGDAAAKKEMTAWLAKNLASLQFDDSSRSWKRLDPDAEK